MPFQTASQIIGDVAAVGFAAFALLRGGVPERLTVLAFFAATIGTYLIVAFVHTPSGPRYGVLAVDTLLLVALLWLALSTDRIWLLWASAFQLVTVVAHLSVFADPRLRTWAYVTALIVFSWGAWLSLVVGTWVISKAARAPHQRAAS